jgi:hypothetical protein
VTYYRSIEGCYRQPSRVRARDIAKLLTRAERLALEEHLAVAPDAHPIVPETRGVRKARWGRGHIGKSGGIRVIYYHLVSRNAIYMPTACAKTKQSNISSAERKILKRLVEQIKRAQGSDTNGEIN